MHKNKFVYFTFQILPLAAIAISIMMILFSENGFTVEALLSYTPDSYFWASVFILFMYAAKSMSVILPISVLYVVTGIIFPVTAALAMNTAGTLICMTLSYWIGYFSGSGYAEKMIEKYPQIKIFVEKQRNNEWFVSYFLRVCPISCDAVSIYLGSLKMPLDKYFIAGMIGSIPGIVSATLLGISITDPFSPMCIFAFSMVVVLSILSYVVYKFIIKRNAKETAEAEAPPDK